MSDPGTGDERTLRVALIGYGAAGVVLHAPLVTATPGLELAAIVTADEGRRRAAAERYPEAAIVADAAAVTSGGFDLVVVATTSGSHADLAQRAIEAGSAVVIDKPMATTSADADGLVRLAAARGVPLTVFQNRRWDSDFLTLRRVLDDERLGRPIRLETRFEVYWDVDPTKWQESPDPALGGGVLLDFGAHRIDQAVLLFGPPRSVAAEIATRRPGAVVEDDVFLSLDFADEARAQIWLSRTAHAGGPSFRMLGSAAAFEIDGSDPQWGALARGEPPGGPGWGRQRSPGRITSRAGSTESVVRVRPERGAYERFYPAVRDAILRGTPVPVDPREAVAVLRVAEAARRSAAEGRPVTLA